MALELKSYILELKSIHVHQGLLCWTKMDDTVLTFNASILYPFGARRALALWRPQGSRRGKNPRFCISAYQFFLSAFE